MTLRSVIQVPGLLAAAACVMICCMPAPAFAAAVSEDAAVENSAPSPAAHDMIEPVEPAEHTAVEAVAPEHAAGEHASPQFPQLDVKTYPSQIFWLIVSFLLLYGLMSKLALPRVTEVVDHRRAQREGNIKQAQQMQEEASQIKEVYEAALAKAQAEAQQMLAEAEQGISERNAEESAKFAAHARARVAGAEQNIAKAKKDALASLADISAEIAVEMVSKIASVQVGKPEAKKAVAAVMQKEAA
jgi:F-type H+-transporting ATPase subunit b